MFQVLCCSPPLREIEGKGRGGGDHVTGPRRGPRGFFSFKHQHRTHSYQGNQYLLLRLKR